MLLCYTQQNANDFFLLELKNKSEKRKKKWSLRGHIADECKDFPFLSFLLSLFFAHKTKIKRGEKKKERGVSDGTQTTGAVASSGLEAGGGGGVGVGGVGFASGVRV